VPRSTERPQVVVHRVVEIAAAAAAADRDAVQPEIVQCPARFLRGARPTQRHRPQPQQPLWCVVHVPGQFLVALGDDVGDEGLVVGGRAEQERRQRHGMPLHTDLVHFRQPDVNVVLRARQREWSPRPDTADPRVQHHDPVGHRGEVGE
jgi:hypothetical protein